MNVKKYVMFDELDGIATSHVATNPGRLPVIPPPESPCNMVNMDKVMLIQPTQILDRAMQTETQSLLISSIHYGVMFIPSMLQHVEQTVEDLLTATSELLQLHPEGKEGK